LEEIKDSKGQEDEGGEIENVAHDIPACPLFVFPKGGKKNYEKGRRADETRHKVEATRAAG